MTFSHRARAVAALVGAMLTASAGSAQAQNAVITGKVLSESGQALEFANVYINELTISVPTNNQGVYTINIPAARVLGQAVNLRVRAVGYVPGAIAIRITAGNQTQDFSLKKDINRLSEVVVTGSIEGTERAKVPFSVGRLTAEDIPVPALNPVTALQGKIAGMRVGATSGQPGSDQTIMLRGPTSINASGRSTGPLLIVDGVILRNQSLNEIGGLDIESVEVVKGAAGASLYGSSAANGVIVIKTKRGASRDGVKFNFRSEYGVSDLSSFDYGASINHHLQLNETGQRFCVAGSGVNAPCSQTTNWMEEIYRINNVNADSVRTPQTMQWAVPGGADLLNVFQSQVWPGQRYNGFAQVSKANPVTLNSLDASGRAGNVRYFVSGAYTSDEGGIKGLEGQQQRRARVNLDYDVRSNLTVSVSTLFDRSRTDNRSGGSSNGGIFGQLLRGAPAGTDYSAIDTLGRAIVKGGGGGLRGSGNGAGTFLYDMQNNNNVSVQQASRYLASISATYAPAEWASFDVLYSYDNRQRVNDGWFVKGYRTQAFSAATNFGSQTVSNLRRESSNAQVSATFRKQLTSDLNGKLNFRGLMDRDFQSANNSGGNTYTVKDVFQLSNLQNQTSFGVGSSSQLIKNMGVIAGANVDYKGRYILDGTYRYDGSSLFGAGNRWAPFGRVSAVWRVSEEGFWNLSQLSDFRVRASRGSAGNTPRFDAQYETYSCTGGACSLGQAGNSKLKPETTTETELGLDATLFNRLGVELTYAASDTKDQILFPTTPAALGFTNKWQNAGTLSNKTWELALNLPVISKKDLQWNMRGTFDRTRTLITQLDVPEYFASANLGNGVGSFFLMTARRNVENGYAANRYGNIYGRKFYKACSDLPASVQSQCGEGKAYQVNDRGWLVWAGEGNSWKDGITKNLWQSKLPAALSPWNYPLQFGHPIVDRPLKGEKGEGQGRTQILGNSLPNFRFAFNNTITYKKLSLYGLLDGTMGHRINNQGEGWGIFDYASSNFDMAGTTVETAKPVGYTWRVGGSEGVGTGGFYDLLGPNNYNVEDGSYAKLREVSLTYQVGRVRGVGDWTVSLIGRNLFTFTNYGGYDPEVGVSGGQGGSGFVNQVDAFDFPTLRTFTFSISTRF
ncbi:MAG: SusC/RagA family TonB-linked outer membrane protein [Gemmatimonadaceae bacterium]|nr:SusC/RagA family TonB-linked outer membrane protein [Gemmatimonadaceae bacterium]